MASIVASERLQVSSTEIVAGVAEEDDPIERSAGWQALEAELSEFLGRERYERRGEPVAYRNGFERVRVRTPAGPLGGAAAAVQRLRAGSSRARSSARA